MQPQKTGNAPHKGMWRSGESCTQNKILCFEKVLYGFSIRPESRERQNFLDFFSDLFNHTVKLIFIEILPFLIHMMILGTILFYKGAVSIKDKQMWLPPEVTSGDKKLKGTLGDAVAALILRAVKK